MYKNIIDQINRMVMDVCFMVDIDISGIYNNR